MARERIIPIFVPHLGCPRACVFCNQSRISGQTRETTAESARAEIESALDKLEGQPAQVAFYGGSFTAIEEHKQEELLQTAYEFVAQGRLTGIRLSTRPDAIDESVVRRLKKYRVNTVELGCQSMDDHVLELAKRGHDGVCCERAAKMLKDAGFQVILQMMTGLPGDDGSQSIETAKKIIALGPDGVRIYPTVVVKDTELYDQYVAGTYQEHTVEVAVELCSVIWEMFQQAGIPVIRLGLNPTEELSGGAAVAGAYHPALGELVRSRVWLKRMEERLNSMERGRQLTITVPKGAVSLVVGQKKCNINAIKEKYDIKNVKIFESDNSNCDIMLKFDDLVDKTN